MGEVLPPVRLPKSRSDGREWCLGSALCVGYGGWAPCAARRGPFWDRRGAAGGVRPPVRALRPGAVVNEPGANAVF